MKLSVMILALLLAASALFAQGFGGFGGGMFGAAGGNTILLNTPKGLFALRTGVLVKFDIATLKPVDVYSLFGDAPEQPKDMTDRTAVQKYYQDIMRRQAPAVMLATDDSLLIVIGDGFARLNQDTLKVDATADLRVPGATDAAAGMPRMPEGAPSYILVGNTLYLMRSKEMMAISIMDGKIQRTNLPKELLPADMSAAHGNRGGGNN